jgi:AraC family transcriptional regulator, transcriptional activator for feuABC-ybbA operon
MTYTQEAGSASWAEERLRQAVAVRSVNLLRDHQQASEVGGRRLSPVPYLVMVQSGQAWWQHPAGDGFAVKPGQAVLVLAGSYANIRHTGPVCLLRLSFEADGTMIGENDIRHVRGQHKSGCLRLYQLPKRSTLEAELLQRLHRWRPTARSQLLPVLLQAVIEQLQQTKDDPSPGAQHYRAACWYLREHLSQELSRDQAAAVLQLSPAYLSRLFRQHAGCSFQDQLRTWRLQQACHLLLSGQRCIDDVARASGFASGHYLAQVFRRRFACSPRQWQARQMAKGED